MSPRNRPSTSVLFLLSIAFLVSSPVVPAQVPSANQVPGATREAAIRLGADPDRLSGLEVATLRFEALGLTVTAASGFDREAGRPWHVVRDQDGRIVDFDALWRSELLLRRATPGFKIDRRLARALATGGAGSLPVIAWLRIDGAALDAHAAQILASGVAAALTHDEARAAEDVIDAFARQHATERVAAFRPVLAASGIRPRYESTSAPAVFFDATPPEILELAARPEVVALYLQSADSADDNRDANATHRTDRVHRLGVRGRSVRVAVLEDNGIDPACPYLNMSEWFDTNNLNPDLHVHATSGCLNSTLASRLGAAPDALLYSANAASYSDPHVTAAADWIAARPVEITNKSFGPTVPDGTLTYLDRYFDYQVRHLRDSYVASAGNLGPAAFVGNTGWNLLVVGSHTDGGNGNWTGDAMSTFSSAANPVTQCEKPNLVANGEDVQTLGWGAPWTSTLSGTSFAAPHAAGNLAGALQVAPVLGLYPEAATALLMATAWHNIEGSSQLSDLDGAGGLHGLAAYRCAADGRVVGGTLTSASFNNNGRFVHSIWLQGGDKTRICLAWLSDPDSAYATSYPQANLDMWVHGGQNQTSGLYFGGGHSWTNNFEIVEMTPPWTGWYSINIDDTFFGGASEGYGLAWSQKTKDTSNARLRERTAEASPTAGPTVGNPAYFMDFQAPNSPGSIFLCVPSGTTGDGLSLTWNTWCPLSPDIWTSFFLDNLGGPLSFWSGWTGALTAAGTTASNAMALPSVPFLAGIPLHHVGFTFESGLPDGIKEITEVHSFRFWPAGTVLNLPDDGSALVPLPFTFRFYGTDWTQCWVNANGNITFGSGSPLSHENAPQFLGLQPRIAAGWDDLNPAVIGPQGTPVVRIRNAGSDVVVEYINLPEAGVLNANTFRITLTADNSIKFEYLDCALQDALVGISPGNGAPSAPEIPFRRSGHHVTGPGQPLFWNYGPPGPVFDLGSPNGWWNEIRFVPTDASATSYRLLVDLE